MKFIAFKPRLNGYLILYIFIICSLATQIQSDAARPPGASSVTHEREVGSAKMGTPENPTSTQRSGDLAEAPFPKVDLNRVEAEQGDGTENINYQNNVKNIFADFDKQSAPNANEASDLSGNEFKNTKQVLALETQRKIQYASDAAGKEQPIDVEPGNFKD